MNDPIIQEVLEAATGAHYRTPNDRPKGTKLLFQSVIMQAVEDLASDDAKLFGEAVEWLFCEEEDTGRGTVRWYAEQLGMNADRICQRIWASLTDAQQSKIKHYLVGWKERLPRRYSVD